jgi:hypothetical protein
LFQKPESARSSLGAGGARALDPRDQFLNEAQGAAGGVGRTLPGADVQDLAGAGASGQDRVIAATAGVAKPGALLVIAMNLTDKRININNQPVAAGAGAGRPRARQAVGQDAIELADMPERERAQKRAQRRGRRDTVAEHRRGLARAQDVAVLDAVGPQRHGADHGHDLAPRIGGARTVAQTHGLIDELLHTEAPGQQRGQHHAGVGNRPLVIEHHDRLLVHHEGDLLSEGRGRLQLPQSSPAWEVTPPDHPDGTVDRGLGRATPMIEVSMMTMNCARAMTASADQRLGLGEGDMSGSSWPLRWRPFGDGWVGEGGAALRTAPRGQTCLERKRRRRRALATTETLENAIAAPAISGLRRPAAASGRAATL